MLKSQVEIGGTYHAKVAGKLTTVTIRGIHPRKGWDAVNNKTGHSIWIKTAQRLRSRVK